jgi:NAD(P)-dependent dehydrogenase (short-subunit alcohol dehydrogenase family)
LKRLTNPLLPCKIEAEKEKLMNDYPQIKTYLVTGATSGIGLAIMEELARKGHQLIGIGRSTERCQKTLTKLKDAHPDSNIEYLRADLSNQSQIRDVVIKVRTILESWGMDGLDGLINNAGTFTYWQRFTSEGFETQWAVNHLAPFLLTNLLLPLLEQNESSRVITVSSGSHYNARLNWSDIQGIGRYNPLKAYKHTKLANVLFTAELNRRLGPESNLRALAADPGLVNTGIGEKSSSRIARGLWARRRAKGISPARSAAGIIRLLESELEDKSDLYWKHGKAKKPNPFALDKDHGWRLWEISARMTGV